MTGFAVLLYRPSSLWAFVVVENAPKTLATNNKRMRMAKAGWRRGATGHFLSRGRRDNVHTNLLSSALR